MRKLFVAGNWKMNGSSREAHALLHTIALHSFAASVECAVFPSFVYLETCRALLQDTPVVWGAQTASEYPNGAYTGEISIAMLADLDCRYVILGHSERRQWFGESNALIARKVKAALAGGIVPVLCVGETLAERDAGRAWAVVEEQLAHVLRLKDNSLALTSLVIAYEPVWAIGTGKTATTLEAQAMHEQIRRYVDDSIPGLAQSVRIIYGGSVKADNAAAFFAMPDIDGALVGGASLSGAQFIEIVRHAEQVKKWNNSLS